jgi:hypothetical protein
VLRRWQRFGQSGAKLICRTCGECHPFDKYYGAKPEAEKLKDLKQGN